MGRMNGLTEEWVDGRPLIEGGEKKEERKYLQVSSNYKIKMKMYYVVEI